MIDPITGIEIPVWTISGIKQIVDLDKNFGEPVLRQFVFDQLYHHKYINQIYNTTNKKLRISREFYISLYIVENNFLNLKKNNFYLNSKDHGTDAFYYDNNKNIKCIEIKTTSALLTESKSRNSRKDQKGELTVKNKSGSFKFRDLNISKNTDKEFVCSTIINNLTDQSNNVIIGDIFYIDSSTINSLLFSNQKRKSTFLRLSECYKAAYSDKFKNYNIKKFLNRTDI